MFWAKLTGYRRLLLLDLFSFILVHVVSKPPTQAAISKEYPDPWFPVSDVPFKPHFFKLHPLYSDVPNA